MYVKMFGQNNVLKERFEEVEKTGEVQNADNLSVTTMSSKEKIL